MARVDINEIVDRIDIEALVANPDLGARMASSTSTVATEAADLEDATCQAITGLRSSYGWANTIARLMWVSRFRRKPHRTNWPARVAERPGGAMTGPAAPDRWILPNRGNVPITGRARNSH